MVLLRASDKWAKLKKNIILEPYISSFAPSNRWSNKDLDPVPPHERTWTNPFYVICYWISDAFTISTWSMASSMIALGLTWKSAFAAIIIGHSIIAIPICLNGWSGAYLHVSFPVVTRASFGMIGNCFVVVSRGFLAIIWGAVQTYIGSECVRQMINAIWPSFRAFPNHLPASAQITSAGLLCFFIYFMIQLPFVLMPMRKIKWLFVVKTIVMPIATIAVLIWALKSAGGTGPVFAQPGTIHGFSKIAWAWLASLNSVLGNYATLSCNIGDFTRYAKKPGNTWVQAIIIPVAFSAFGLIGIIVSSASAIIYKDGVLWDPTVLIDHFDSRAAKFFVAFAFALATLGTNISANTISAANDFSAIFPKVFNIRRGSLIASLLAWICVPWYILNTAKGFLAFMGSYSVILGPIAGVMVSDFWLVRNIGRIDTRELYNPHGKYWYWKGWNWRGYVALICGFIINLPGFLNQIVPSIKILASNDDGEQADEGKNCNAALLSGHWMKEPIW
ncbi:unnamed protein product [Didymodactylos carnosus]|uniref:Uncharacterized protein n=1 Tax=Didymodactylos carnosus TaxID=1234261 RepID=A0A814KMZ1_9BILA|nr:unnamed protein product [Didymodactylos carnosus]CAF3823873.1 unnamed protein product [Didymodactylos carnosus]